ncbi:outer membrane protein/peptidoglycan-associated (lipo)protein [Rheinheimera sp. A13L]|uniref:OmpA family protein n=1 Tax=Rheinheimera sp. A13L TaxID=506534 RepID=UPI0002124A47|nr:OmpA family protein [Rheinheimera sp. A13L]EGM78319.1 outer membrane protein/peptidoglycan-associated (lipo)protein [Rheinheimera sp. A13L]
MNSYQATRNEQVIGQQSTALNLSSTTQTNTPFFRFKPLVLSVLTVLMLPAAHAMDYSNFKENGWSVGMNVGKSIAGIEQDTIRTDLENQGFNVNSVSEDSRSEGYKIFVGYKFNPYLAVEGGYFNIGGFHALANTTPVTDFRGKTKLLGWNLDLVGIMPFTEDFSGFARIGVTQNDTSNSYSSNGLVDVTGYNEDGSYTKNKYGLGLQYNISPILSVRLEAERYRLDDLIAHSGNIDMYSLGLMLRFGETEPTYAATPAPEPVRRAEAVAVAPTAVASEPTVLELEDVHFNFDTSELNDETKTILREHVQTLKANPQAKVRIAGYTSASGTAEYNQALSERRAQSIKAFLILEGVDANRFKTIGFGQRNPAEYEANPAVLRSDAAKANMRGLFEIIVE